MTEPSPCPIDPTAFATLEEVADGDNEFLFEIISQYLHDAPLLVEVFAPALLSGDAEALERAAHTLKSASANVGAMTLSNLCEELQRIAKSGDLVDARATVPAAEAEHARAQDELESRRAELKHDA